ncbi:putative membrane protein [Geodermatophilus bullaregiensis]|uniref:PH domain-containing protein n=1 Tax=Geodermatophilus bullaregiensis TaxID=1564160 RepID=UPI0027DD4CC9|nr:PH domain-containing protein [Geodermatophilus bullaregiensis]MBM7806837.1 putative membrane protein [Geodermatophilus bullaregiensis]
MTAPGTPLPPAPVSAPPPAARRSSPLVVLVHTVTFRQARQVVPAAIPIIAAVGPDGPGVVVALVGVVTALSLLFAALSWWRTTYADTPAAVVVTRGLLARSVRTVPNDRIRGVEVEAPVLHRLFGLVRVRVDAAAGSMTGGDEEVVVDGVPRAEGDRLRASVLTHRRSAGRGGTDPSAAVLPEEAPAEVELARFSPRWLLYAPLVAGYLAVPLAAVGALSRLLQELPRGLQPDLTGPDLSDARVLAVAVVAALLLLAAGAVLGAAVVNWGFRLVRRGGSLVAVRGLVTRRHTELEVDRVRGGTLAEGLGMRLVRAARVNALVTGLGAANRRGQVLPLGPRVEAVRLLGVLVDDPGPLRPHPPAARRRRLARAVGSGLVVTAAGAALTAATGWWGLLAAGVVLTVLGVPLGLGRYAALGHAVGPRSFTVRSGLLVREQAVLQRRAVVGWQVRQSVVQRRAGLATVVACVGAGVGGYAAVDMAAADVGLFTQAASGRWATAPGGEGTVPAG